VRSIATEAGQPVRIWVCSAGYGLLPIDTPLTPYSATFAPGQLDSVCTTGGAGLRTALPEWWAAVAAFGDVHAGPRTIAGLAEAYPDEFLLVALPDAYLTAVAADLTASAAVATPEQLAVLSVGGAAIPGLEEYRLPAAGRLSRLAGGSLGALNARLSRLLIRRADRRPLTRSWCRAQLTAWLAEIRTRRRPQRAPLTDGELRTAVRLLLASDPDARPTPLLQRLRQSGRACEYTRFVTLFRELKGERHAQS